MGRVLKIDPETGELDWFESSDSKGLAVDQRAYEKLHAKLMQWRDSHPDVVAWAVWRAMNPAFNVRIAELSPGARQLWEKKNAVWSEYHDKEADLWHAWHGVEEASDEDV